MTHAILILTTGGLVRSLKAGCPEHAMHLYWTGFFAPREPNASIDRDGNCGKAQEYLIEIELLRIEGNNAIVRINAPPQVSMVSAKKDPQCQGSDEE